MDEILVVLIVFTIFVIMPAVILHYMTAWKKAGSLSARDEDLLNEMYDTARRLEARLETVERIIAADHPDFKTRN